MFRVDPHAARQLAAAIGKIHRDHVKTLAVEGYTRAVFDAAENDDAELLTQLELVYSAGQTRADIGLANRILREPSDVPVALRVARRMTQETGRTPKITIGVQATLDLERELP